MKHHHASRPLARIALLAASVSLASFRADVAAAENWPQWRGPTADGVSTETGLPVEWSAEKNVVWRVDLPGRGQSTPILWGDRVFLTYQVGDGPVEGGGAGPAGPGGRGRGAREGSPPVSPDSVEISLRTAAWNAKTGELLWEQETPIGGAVTPAHRKHNMASPSCIADGERVVSWFGTGPVVCRDLDGKLLWERNLAAEYGDFAIKWGHGSSPAFHGNKVVLLCDHREKPYMIALDKTTGATVWRVEREIGDLEELRSYTTPYFIRAGGRDEMLVQTSGRIEAFDPETGKSYWRAEGLLKIMCPMPVESEGVVIASGGYRNAPIFAIRPGGEGDATDSILWKRENGAPYVPSVVVSGKEVFMVNDEGIATCIDLDSGDTVWKERLGGTFSSSPVVAEGRVYMIDEDGRTVVFAASREFKLLAENEVAERALASIAISGGRIFFRTDERLYCVGN